VAFKETVLPIFEIGIVEGRSQIGLGGWSGRRIGLWGRCFGHRRLGGGRLHSGDHGAAGSHRSQQKQSESVSHVHEAKALE